jgi:short-subunit dehydrogenase
MSENILVLGATSGIARALCHELARRGCRLVLAGRDADELGKVASDLHVRYGTDGHVEPFDALDYEGHSAFFGRCLGHFNGDLTGVVLCYGYMTDQARTETDFCQARRTIDVNLTSAVSLLSLAANHLELSRQGFIAAIASVAGDRGRQSNYTYGAAKAGLATYLQGLRNRLCRAGVHVLTVKPGFVDTPMTQGLLNPKSPLVASPARVARDIDRAIRKRKNTLYTPWFWWGILAVIRSIPEPIFKRLRL